VTWILLVCLAATLGVGLVLARREELARMADAVAARERAVRAGANEARLQHPVVDLSRCLGCGTCVAACPEDGVLELVHGQAAVVRSARCVGVAACERECPVGAITVTVANLAERSDVPAVDERLEAVGSPGIFLAGEVTALALVRTAIEHGVRVAREVALRIAGTPHVDALDLLIVGAGPAGMAASLEAKRLGLKSVTLEQELGPGGTVAKYPRAKLVINEPIELPLFGRLKRNAYRKEELIALWTELATRHTLPIEYGERYERIERDATTGIYTVWSTGGAYAARNVLFAVGRRGTPRKLGVPGEELEKVTYALVDATQHTARRVLVVGGGDAAVEAALGLAEQPGNHVTLSYRRDELFRLRARNSERLEAAVAARTIEVLTRSEVVAITPGAVELALVDGPRLTKHFVANDEVLVLAGGTPPTELLEAAGVSFDPRLRPPPRSANADTNSAVLGVGGLVRALAVALSLTLLCAAFVLWHRDYYFADAAARATHTKHDLLRAGRGLGLAFGFAATALVGANLVYLLRRGAHVGVTFGSLRTWMTVHIATGVLAFLCGALHAAMAPGHTVGGHALLALTVLLVTGGIGRYFYSSVPRAANGRELALEEVRTRLDHESTGDIDTFSAEARGEVLELARQRQWGGHLAGRIAALCGVKLDLRRALRSIDARGRARGVERERIDEALSVARRAHRLALEAAHLEDLRALLSGWRWLHRWVTALMLALVTVHVAHAVLYGGVLETLAEALQLATGGAAAR
jgi:thioredoxin reductase/Pyruvate/2-oxoacid:ferredoxin oxidoreductase delta subunit